MIHHKNIKITNIKCIYENYVSYYLIVDHTLQSTSIRVPTLVEKDKGTSRTDGSSRRDQTKQSIMEKQVSFFIPYESN